MHNEYNFSIIFNRSPAFVWKEIWFVYIFVCFHVCYCKMLILYYIYIFGIVLIKQQLIWERKNCHSLCVHVPAFFPCSISSLSRFFLNLSTKIIHLLVFFLSKYSLWHQIRLVPTANDPSEMGIEILNEKIMKKQRYDNNNNKNVNYGSKWIIDWLDNQMAR